MVELALVSSDKSSDSTVFDGNLLHSGIVLVGSAAVIYQCSDHIYIYIMT